MTGVLGLKHQWLTAGQLQGMPLKSPSPQPHVLGCVVVLLAKGSFNVSAQLHCHFRPRWLKKRLDVELKMGKLNEIPDTLLHLVIMPSMVNFSRHSNRGLPAN